MTKPSKDLMSTVRKIHNATVQYGRDKEWREWLDRMIPDWDAIEGYDANPPPDRK